MTTPLTKTARHARIADILAREQVRSQEELADLLERYAGLPAPLCIRSGDPADTMSAPFCDRSMPSAWQSRAGPRARSRGAMAVVPRVRRAQASSSPAMTRPARSSIAEALPSSPRQTTFAQKCMP